jgi:polyketide cyclase/dehydrase/lipid transport protein
MATVRADALREVGAPAERVYALLRDYHQRSRLLPAQYSGYRVTAGGEGAGTEYEVTLRAGRRERAYRMRVEEPEPGEVLRESDADTSLVSEWRVARGAREDSTVVEIVTSWEGAGGIGGLFERTFAPGALRRIYDEQLAAVAQALSAGGG